MQTGDILIVDADSEDREMLSDIVRELKITNQCRFFRDGDALIAHLWQSDAPPFLILSEIRLPKMSGFELRQYLLSTPDSRFKSVPFIFWSSSASEADIQRAYDLSAHGFFLKPPSFVEMERDFQKLVQYWRTSKMPTKRPDGQGRHAEV